MRRQRIAVTGFTLALALAACGGDGGNPDGGPYDAARPDGSIPGVASPAPPDIPWLETGLVVAPPAPPVITPCPAGFREVELGCEPWPETGRATCTGSAAHFPGEPGCRVVGGTCPAGVFPPGLPNDGTVIFVREGSTGGDGTEASPFATITEAMAVATAGKRVIVARGEYSEGVTIAPGVALEGVCASETFLTSTESWGIVYSDSAGTALRNITIRGGAGPAIIVTSRAGELTVEGVFIDGAKALGLLADASAHLVARDVVVQGMRAHDDGSFGRAVLIQSGAVGDIERAVFSRSREAAVAVGTMGSRLTLRRAAILDTAASGISPQSGWGVWAQAGGIFDGEAIVVEGNRTVGVVASGATLTLDASVVRGTLPTSTGTNGQGVYAEEGATVRVTRSVIANNVRQAVVSYGGSEVLIEDSILRDTQRDGSGEQGDGVDVQEASMILRRVRLTGQHHIGIRVADSGLIEGEDVYVADPVATDTTGGWARGAQVIRGELRLTRALLERNRDAAIYVVGGTLTVADVAMRDTVAEVAQASGFGIAAGEQAIVTGERVSFERNFSADIFGSDVGTAFTLSDVHTHGTLDHASGTDASGSGMDMRDGASFDGTRVLVDEPSVLGIAATRGATITLTDAVVRRTRSRESSGTFGRGLNAQEGAQIVLTRVVLSENREAGIFLTSADTSATLTDVVIRDTMPGSAATRGGRGIEIQFGSSITASRLVVERARQVAVFLSTEATFTGSDVAILDTFEDLCADTTCMGTAQGTGLGVFRGATARLTDFAIDVAPLCGVQIAENAGVDLLRGTISHANIGGCIHDSGYDIERLTSGVAYRDNGANIESVDFAIPEPTPSLDDVAP